jgi:outer membrane biosynthesis protein TonB
MKFREIITATMTVSVLAHALLLGGAVVLSEVHRFGPIAADAMPVTVVTPQELAEIKPEPSPVPTPTPQPDLAALDKPAEPTAQAAPAAEPPTPPPQPKPQTPAAKAPPSPAKQAAAQPKAPEPPPAPQPMPPTPQQPAYTPPAPDLMTKYRSEFGPLPDLSPATLAVASQVAEERANGFDAPATDAAKIETGIIAEFRRHLKTCMKRPAELQGDENIRIKLRVSMTQDGKLAAEPLPVEITAASSTKGPALLQAAVRALQTCQPYAMLPRDRYREWKVLDLDFTPREFAS